MGEQPALTLGDEPFPHEVDHSLHRFALVDRVGDHAFGPRLIGRDGEGKDRLIDVRPGITKNIGRPVGGWQSCQSSE